jgi:hypothetical protein
MDAAVERIFDPNAYLSHIAPLESTTAAIRIAAKESQVIVPVHMSNASPSEKG